MRRRGAALAGAAAAALALGAAVAGCGGDDPAAGTSAQADAVIAQADAIPLTSTVNGEVPPGRVALVTTSTRALQFMRGDEQVSVYRDVRPAGTRAPIHVHPFGGWTCVVKGQAVLYLEGSTPITTRAGGCVNMPPLRPMSNYNPGPGPAVLLDSFVEPPGSPVWRVIEKGYTDLGNEFAHGDHGTQTNP